MSLEFTKVLCLLCFLALVVVEIDSRLCGENLDTVLAVVCENQFNTMINKKRSNVEANDNAMGNNEPMGLAGFGPFAEPSLLQRMLGEGSHSLVKTRRMRRVGIYEECCLRSCSYHEMRNYCL